MPGAIRGRPRVANLSDDVICKLRSGRVDERRAEFGYLSVVKGRVVNGDVCRIEEEVGPMGSCWIHVPGRLGHLGGWAILRPIECRLPPDEMRVDGFGGGLMGSEEDRWVRRWVDGFGSSESELSNPNTGYSRHRVIIPKSCDGVALWHPTCGSGIRWTNISYGNHTKRAPCPVLTFGNCTGSFHLQGPSTGFNRPTWVHQWHRPLQLSSRRFAPDTGLLTLASSLQAPWTLTSIIDIRPTQMNGPRMAERIPVILRAPLLSHHLPRSVFLQAGEGRIDPEVLCSGIADAEKEFFE
ncbi:hypothetical protein DFP72DRAFT_844773 [Ephemerocybe angulata]|uniref:Uncharacterized protein n=1 Tax=Ephemerocybe angulata TaxID=980116 RepID=A0A8H6MAL8_9AGAR|nr:hypothetical protein DFP72DRAFT_844773 [Tulosesus angulatus]